ncbi:uncharacterized protein LOC110976238 [Acanthaster planci]|uniref:Uncharacterized protein LOC110976238 n=1 Tax=Acanthaster planci TaxID=133434 RepID=A0A8B7XYC7_ACAPL|nr:uncharacterized protein LOC110976238 [Acanthaster planci]
MGRGGRMDEWAGTVVIVVGCIFFGLAAAAEFSCYDCAALLSPESSCETGPDFNSTTKCKTYCYTDVTTQAGVRSYMKRGCTTELECTEETTCRELSRTGPCRSCCQSNLCNDDEPDLDAINRAGKVGVVWSYGGRSLGVVIGVAVAFVDKMY